MRESLEQREANPYRDGHLSPNQGASTFYKNWPGRELKRLYRLYSLSVVRDLSRFLCRISTRKASGYLALNVRAKIIRRCLDPGMKAN
jgi:hypothetical protein